ncbi:regulator of chromosome condensation 1/beta-lactamase-inhibitor protein II [Scheffersomyces amazonensis]|uniref:regulator of chromosome condensation 1/beta-lactamase-inhibitor protein II n=1 Tax=Scheffersomyces amazonensis TaxID=1078765 RepID=UPI00315CEA80
MTTLTIFDLGDDVLVDTITKYLSYRDIFNFSITNKYLYNLFYHSPLSSIIYNILYLKKYTNNENHNVKLLKDFNWKKLFSLRSDPHQKLYTWGSADMGRLGYKFASVPSDHQSINPTFTFRPSGIHTPTNLDKFNNHILVDVIANGFSFIILTNEGSLYYTGANWKSSTSIYRSSTPGPIEGYDYYEPPSTMYITRDSNALGARRTLLTHLPSPDNRYDRDIDINPDHETITQPQGRRRLPATNLTLPPERLNPMEGINSDGSISPSSKPNVKESEFVTKLKLPPWHEEKDFKRKIISISSGREHILALDNYNNLYTWDSGTRTDVGIRLKFPGLDIIDPIEKIVAGWNLSGCYIESIGLIIWYTRIPFSEEQFKLNDFSSETKYFIIPGTRHNIIDFALGADLVLFIKKSDKKLYKLQFSVHEFARTEVGINIVIPEIESLDSFNNWLKNYNIYNGLNSNFSKVSCCFNNFVVFTDHDSILLGSKSDDNVDANNLDTVKVIEELQHQNIKSIEIGDYHYLALTTDGNVLSWGIDSKNCGCLGLGPKEKIKDIYGSNSIQDHQERGFTATKPLMVKNPPYPGKWLAIAANGWHSGGIYVPLNVE